MEVPSFSSAGWVLLVDFVMLGCQQRGSAHLPRLVVDFVLLGWQGGSTHLPCLVVDFVLLGQQTGSAHLPCLVVDFVVDFDFVPNVRVVL